MIVEQLCIDLRPQSLLVAVPGAMPSPPHRFAVFVFGCDTPEMLFFLWATVALRLAHQTQLALARVCSPIAMRYSTLPKQLLSLLLYILMLRASPPA